ncbi:unnamed protein product [Ambrosiozyma monospora]|uniref:Unnamed protein product n=1 Tax=Ambrosiozyma monospora TaxID=43982 RepID=A0ACB5T1N7_AMBMO|nr:unnamed protein product [Ambrosiozyma monospora]
MSWNDRRTSAINNRLPITALFLCLLLIIILQFTIIFKTESNNGIEVEVKSFTMESELKKSEFEFKQLTFDNFEDELDKHLDILNATAIFNDVNNVLKQKNTDLYPVGVSYLPVYIPEGTLLYHANRDGKTPSNITWAAMDYEFSYHYIDVPRVKPQNLHPTEKRDTKIPHIFTLEVKRPLDKLILLTGASASKLPTGEMDSQYLLAQVDVYEDFDEKQMISKICRWGQENGGLDGLVRLEVGFEVILCDVTDKLNVIHDLTLADTKKFIGFPTEEKLPTEQSEGEKQQSLVLDKFEAMAGFDNYLAGSRVYDSEKRILPDFSKLVTLLNRTYIDPDPYKRRIYNASNSTKEKVLTDLSHALKTPNDPSSSTNWQIITEGIVSKFGPMLVTFNSCFTNFEHVHHDTGLLGQELSSYTFNYIRRYISSTTYNFTTESRKLAVWDHAHPIKHLTTPVDHLIWSSIAMTQQHIVDVVYDTFLLSRDLLSTYNSGNSRHIVEPERIKKGQEQVRNLLDKLNWPLFYRCSQTCGFDEICFVPTWGPSRMNMLKNTAGLEIGGYKERARISKDLVCISYKDMMDNT